MNFALPDNRIADTGGASKCRLSATGLFFVLQLDVEAEDVTLCP